MSHRANGVAEEEEMWLMLSVIPIERAGRVPYLEYHVVPHRQYFVVNNCVKFRYTVLACSIFFQLPTIDIATRKSTLMADNIPSAVEGEDHHVPANAEDRKAAAALSSLNDNDISQDSGAGTGGLSSAAAEEALGKAMSRLEIAAGSGSKKGGAASQNKGAATENGTEVKKKAVKIAAEDVTLLVRLAFRITLLQ